MSISLLIFREKFSRCFFFSSAFLLVGTGIAKLYSASGNARILLVIDPLLGISNGKLMILTGASELIIAIYLTFGSAILGRSLLLLWLSSNFMFYRIASGLLDVEMCPCLGTLTQNLPIRPEYVNVSLMLVVLYMFIGSGTLVAKAVTSQSSGAGTSHSPLADLAR